MTDKKKIVGIVAAVCAVVVFAGGVGTSVYMNVNMNKRLAEVETLSDKIMKENKKLKQEIEEADDYDEEDYDEDWEEEYRGEVTYEEGDYYHENGELIEIDEYKIRDFDYIAQAYLTGDDSTLTSDADKETLKLATEVIKEIITDDMTMYEKELAIHDWLCENVTFDEDSLEAIINADTFADTPYGVLKYKSAVCVGYATTFRLLTTMVGMECDIIHDSDYSHTWNIIKLDDGEYYLVDVYSDANDGKASHMYFNISEDRFLEEGYYYDTDRYPTANGSEYSYANMAAVKLAGIEELVEKVAGLKNEGGEIYFTLTDSSTTADVVYVLDNIMNRIDSTPNGYCDYDVVNPASDNPLFYILVEIYDYDEEYFGEDYGELTIDVEEIDTMLDEYIGPVKYN